MQQLLLTSGIIIGLIALWVGVQALVRRSSHMAPDTDVLACRTCNGEGSCNCGLKTGPTRPTRPGD